MNKGLTLIETVLYIALLAVLIVVVMPLFFEWHSLEAKQNTQNTATRDYLFLDGKMRFFMQKSTRLITPRRGEYSDVLSFDTENEGIMTIRKTDQLILDYEEGDDKPLFSTSTLISRVSFYRPDSPGPERLLFSTVINNFDFGTSSYAFRDE